jgi:hypothetical protein
MNGSQIRIYFRAYNSPDLENLRYEVSTLSLFNYYICLNGYKFCDADSSFKCLKEEGYFEFSNFYYSCYERCGKCDTYKRTPFVSLENHYCDECHSKYPLYRNMHDNNKNKDYKNCYEECPFPFYKSKDSNECLKCINYTTNDLDCVDACDSHNYKYILENYKICYKNIPTDYYAYISDYNIKYEDDQNFPIINLGKECPNDNYVIFNSYCLNSIKDIFSLISPLYFNQYKNPIKI